MAGDPSLPATESLALACERGGADLLELGIPFPNPVADGPEIRRANRRALASGADPRGVIDLVARLRTRVSVPIVLMSYEGAIRSIGPWKLRGMVAAVGVDGLLVPDLSHEDSEELGEIMDSVGVAYIRSVAPSTPRDRARAIAVSSRGFLYVVARRGTTGIRAGVPPDLGARITALRRICSLPLAVGFGVSTREQVQAIASLGADGVVVGSAIVREIAKGADGPALEAFVAELASGLRRPAVTSLALRDSSP